MRMGTIAISLIILSTATTAGAESSSPSHEGFFLRMQLGAGSLSSNDDGVEIGGPAGHFTIALGGVVAPNLILFGELVAHSVTSPKIKIDGVQYTVSGATLSTFGFGPGISYYIMPANVYLSASLNFTEAEVEAPGVPATTSELGLAGRFAIGKEWWVSESVGLGLAATASVGKIEEATASALGISFSFTLN